MMMIATLDHLDVLVENNIAMAMETEGKELDPTVTRLGAKALIEDITKGFYLVAIKDDRVIGQLMITYEWSDWRNGDFWWVQSVFVSKDHRSNGIFTALFHRLVEMAEGEKVVGLRLYVDRNNRTAKDVYLKLGFRESHYDMFEMAF